MAVNARITAHKGMLILDTVATASSAECKISIDSPEVIGQVFSNTKDTVEISEEAMELIRSIPRGGDSIGDFDWFALSDGNHALGWLGPIKRLLNPKTSETSRQFAIGEYISIANNPPEEAVNAIESNH